MLMVTNLCFLNMTENHDKRQAFGQAKYLNFSKENGFLCCFFVVIVAVVVASLRSVPILLQQQSIIATPPCTLRHIELFSFL